MKISVKEKKVLLFPIFLVFLLLNCGGVCAEDKQWSGNDDALSWEKDINWFFNGVPALADNVVINAQGASVTISKTSEIFNAASLTVGGRTGSTVTVENFVYGLIDPASSADNALYIRKDGEVVLQGGGGVVTLKGMFMNSEQTIPNEPAFMFGAE